MTSRNKTTTTSFEKQLNEACRELVYISETDSRVEPFFDAEPTGEKGVEIPFDKFFNRLTSKKEWHSNAVRKNAEGFAKLETLLESELGDLRVYKYGNIQIDIIVVGRDKHGKVAGVKMHAVET